MYVYDITITLIDTIHYSLWCTHMWYGIKSPGGILARLNELNSQLSNKASWRVLVSRGHKCGTLH